MEIIKLGSSTCNVEVNNSKLTKNKLPKFRRASLGKLLKPRFTKCMRPASSFKKNLRPASCFEIRKILQETKSICSYSVRSPPKLPKKKTHQHTARSFFCLPAPKYSLVVASNLIKNRFHCGWFLKKFRYCTLMLRNGTYLC